MSRKMRTTTLIVDTPINYDRLESQFQLVRYTVPERFRYIKGNSKYGRLHTQLKEQLDHPYRFYTHDEPTPLGIYVLYEPDAQIQDIKLDFLNDGQNLTWSRTQFERLPLHILLKLLQANYFKSRRTTEFVSQSKYYIQAKVGRSEVICLEIELKGDLKNPHIPDGQPKEFKIIGHATRFIKRDKSKITESYKRIYPYFHRMSPKKGQSFFNQLPPAEIDDFRGDIYGIWQDSSERATLDYHSQLRPEGTRGKILYDFTRNFVEYLNHFGISARQKIRDFTEYKPSKGNAELPLVDLEVIHLFDNRLNQKDIPFEAYHQLLKEAYPHISFEVIEGVGSDFSGPMLILQDYNAGDFAEGGILAGQPDPYQQLYQHETYRDLPKQSIIINSNDANSCIDGEDYLTYPMLSLPDNDQRFDVRFAMCFNQLYLKDLISNRWDVIGRLPYLTGTDQDPTSSKTPLQNCAFVRKKTYDGNTFHTLLYIDNGKLTFADLRDPNERQKLYSLLERYGLDWDDDIIEPFNQKNLSPDREEEAIKRYDFMIGPNQVIEIEDMNERVLYEYDTILERKAELDKPYPLEELRLADHYDTLRTKKMLSQLVIEEAQSNVGSAQQSTAYIESMAFLERLQAFDEFLDELALNRTEISFNELTSGENMVKIGHIFDIKPNSQGKYNRGKLKRYYQRLGMFLSAKSADVQSYSGIWYDAENCFMVGSPQGLHDRQPRAHLIRKFDVYKGEEYFHINTFLETMGVKFVRYQQYTVYPYFFHLIDLYVETKLRLS